MKLWEYLVKNFDFTTEDQVRNACGMSFVTVDGITCRYHDTIVFDGQNVSVIQRVTKTVNIFDDETPELDISSESLDEDKLKHDSPESCGGLSGTHYDK